MPFDLYKVNLVDQLRKFESRQERRKNIFFFNLPLNLMFYLIFVNVSLLFFQKNQH